MLLFAIMLIIASIVYYVSQKKYKETEYYKQTKNSLIGVWLDKGKLGEYKIFQYLKSLDGYKQYLFNLYLPKDHEGTTELDVVLLHESGVYVFESKNYSGWIFGTETQKNWTQTLPTGRGRSRKNHFYNPIMQNKGHIKWLKSYLNDETLAIFSCIVFSERCTLKDINLTSREHAVIQRFEVLDIVRRTAAAHPQILTQAQIDGLYQRLFPLTQVGADVKLEHIQQINSSTQRPAPTSAPVLERQKDSLVCPRCGGKLVLRTASKGQYQGNKFYGCSNYPRCRYMSDMDLDK